MGKFLHISFCRTILVPFSNPFIPTSFIKPHQIKKLPHPRPNPISIAFLQFLGIKIGGGMGLASIIDKKLVARKQYLPNDITILPKMPSSWFNTQIIKTEELGISIVLNNLIADMVKAKYNVPAGYDLIGPLMGDDVFQQFHETGLTTSYRSGKKKAFVDVDAQLGAAGLVLDEVEAELIENFPVFTVDLKLFAEQELSFGIEIDKDLFKIVMDFPALKGAQWVLVGSLCDDMWSMVLHRGSL